VKLLFIKIKHKLQNYFKKKYIQIPSLIFIILFVISLIGYVQNIQRPLPTMYINESFQKGIHEWVGVDYTWIDQENEQEQPRKGIVKLARKEYLAPYLMYKIPLDKAPQESFVWHFRTKVSSFTDDAIVLGALIVPNDTITISVNDRGQLGIGHHLFEPPRYSESLLGKVTKEKWEDIHVYIDVEEKELTLFIDNKRVLKEELHSETYPVQEIWIGAIWLKGAGNYGAPLNIQYDEISIGNKGILPKPSYVEYLKVTMEDTYQYIIDKTNDS